MEILYNLWNAVYENLSFLNLRVNGSNPKQTMMDIWYKDAFMYAFNIIYNFIVELNKWFD